MPKWRKKLRPGRTIVDIAMPFSPGKYMEVQHGEDIYRCVFKEGKPVMKFINMLKCLYELEQAELAKTK